MTTRRRRIVLALLLSTLLITGCNSPGADERKDDSLPTATEEQVTARVQQYTDQTAAAVGGGTLENPDMISTACEGRNGELAGDDKFKVLGGGQIPIPLAQHRATLTRLHDQWKNGGWTITEYRFTPQGTGALSARNPADGYQVALQSTAPPTALALSVYSPCFEKPASPTAQASTRSS